MKILRRTLIGSLALLVIILIFIGLLPGYDMYVVKSQSMQPAIGMGDMVITGPVHGILSQGIKPGMVVTYQLGQVLISHRVVSFDGKTLVTRGDAVEDLDPQTVDVSQVKGLYLLKIPKLGYLSAFIHTKLGWFLLVILPAVLLEAFIVREIIKEALSVSTPAAGRN
jgi:signal peptidase I